VSLQLLRTDPAEGRKAMREAARACARPVNDEINTLDAELARYESLYGMTSETALARIASGQLREDEVVCRWAMTYKRWLRLATLKHGPNR
jgi:hypothetical protein